jgi:hypothetical protein
VLAPSASHGLTVYGGLVDTLLPRLIALVTPRAAAIHQEG